MPGANQDVEGFRGHQTGASPGRKWTASVSSSAVTLSHGYDPVVMCDWEGRILYIVRAGRTFRRGLGGQLLEKGYQDGRRWARIETDPVRVRALLQDAFALVDEAVGKVLENSADSSLTGSAPAGELRARLAGWHSGRSLRSPNDLERDRRRFVQVCQVPPVLPPDQYRALLVQVTTGCPWNACRFCSLYSERAYRVLPLEELLKHSHEVVEYMGAGLSYRQSVFLGDASLSRLSPDAIARRARLVGEMLREASPGRKWTFHAFADAFTPAAWRAEELPPLVEAGVRRFHVGAESGSQAVLDAVGKPQSPEKVLRLVTSLKEGGLNVSCIFIAGLGGRRLRAEHVAQTSILLERMPLGLGDLVYISPLLERSTPTDATEPPLREDEIAGEEADLRLAIEPWRKTRGFRVARYDLREFVY